MLLNVAANSANSLRRSVARGTGPATQAGSVAGFLSLIGTVKESDVLPPRTPRRARWPAINTGRRHGEYEAAILAGITGLDGMPPAILAASHHFNRTNFSSVQVEYRIGCHSEES